jgi:hypothetical protein
VNGDEIALRDAEQASGGLGGEEPAIDQRRDGVRDVRVHQLSKALSAWPIAL